jgi:hypothetical protein
VGGTQTESASNHGQNQEGNNMTKPEPKVRAYVPMTHESDNLRDAKALAQMQCFTVEGDENIYLEHKGLVVPGHITYRNGLYYPSTAVVDESLAKVALDLMRRP